MEITAYIHASKLLFVSPSTSTTLSKQCTLHKSKGALPAFIRLQRQISCFGDEEGLKGLMKHVGDEEANCEVLGML
jgi:hypothetical protein